MVLCFPSSWDSRTPVTGACKPSPCSTAPQKTPRSTCIRTFFFFSCCLVVIPAFVVGDPWCPALGFIACPPPRLSPSIFIAIRLHTPIPCPLLSNLHSQALALSVPGRKRKSSTWYDIDKSYSDSVFNADLNPELG